MKSILVVVLSVFCFLSTAEAASRKWYCQMPNVSFNDAQGNPLAAAYYIKVDQYGSQQYTPLQSLQDYLNAVSSSASICSRWSVSCYLDFLRNLTPVAEVQSSTISLADCVNRLRPAQKVTNVCHKEYFTQASLSSAKHAPKIGELTFRYAYGTAATLRNNPQYSRYQVDCMYFPN